MEFMYVEKEIVEILIEKLRSYVWGCSFRLEVELWLEL